MKKFWADQHFGVIGPGFLMCIPLRRPSSDVNLHASLYRLREASHKAPGVFKFLLIRTYHLSLMAMIKKYVYKDWIFCSFCVVVLVALKECEPQTWFLRF